MPDDAICKRILVNKANEYRNDPLKGARNEYSSPIFELLNVSKEFGILDTCLQMIDRGFHMSKLDWKKKIWEIAWQREDEGYELHRCDALMFKVIDRPFYLVWWIIADLLPHLTINCEIMSKLVCKASLLKDHDYRLKRKSFSHKVCTRCVLGIREDVNHIVMQCPCNEGSKQEMLEAINALDSDIAERIFAQPQDVFSILMGRHPADTHFEFMLKLWVISSTYIAEMYRNVIKSR